MAAGVSINPIIILKGLIFTTLFTLTFTFKGVPYDVESLDRAEDVAVSKLYSIHRVRRQATGSNDTAVTQSTVSVTMVPSTSPVVSTQTTEITGTTPPPGPTTTNPTTNATVIRDVHKYYSSTTVVDYDMARSQWIDLDDPSIGATVITHKTLSNSHRTAASVSLKFNFPFYGHLVRKITIATGGFLYASDFLHRWLTATQYIAPLMANFDTRIGESSNIRYINHADMMVAQWEDVFLKDEQNVGSFTFQVSLHKTGKIIFAYKKVPKAIHKLSTVNHPVKVGVSDAYYQDRLDGTLRRRTIIEYHRVTISNEWIDDNTAVILTPVRTCISLTDCKMCNSVETDFKCAWCGRLKLCSDGTDRYRQQWREAKCTTDRSDPCPPQNTVNVAAIVVILIVIAVLLGIIIGFVVYAYKNPNSKAGIWLIEHRPSKIASNIASKISFWKGNSSNAGDKYEVSITPESQGAESKA